jgi:Zn-dependent protease with chaperone function
LLVIAHAAAFSVTTSKPPQQRVYWDGLAESGFRYPLDFDLTSLVRSYPLHGAASSAIRKSLSIVEEGLRLQLLSSSVRISEQQLPEIQDLLIEASKILTVPTPELYIQSSSVANAYTLASVTSKNSNSKSDKSPASKPIIVVTSALLEQCSPPEIQAILGHELGHLKCEHSIYLTLGSLIASTLPIQNQFVQDWRLAAEYSCDRAALLVAQDIDVVNGAMLKLFAGTNNEDLNVEAFLAQSQEYDELLEKSNPLVKRSIQRERRTHPLPVRRLSELKKWSESDEYQKLLKRAAQLDQYL